MYSVALTGINCVFIKDFFQNLVQVFTRTLNVGLIQNKLQCNEGTLESDQSVVCFGLFMEFE